MHELTKENILDYFSLSPFYEINSINERCFKQKCDFRERKKDFKGIEFNLEDSKDHDLFIISKSERRNSHDLILISYYYIFRGNIYQSPNLFSVLTSNVEVITNNINNLILEMNELNN